MTDRIRATGMRAAPAPHILARTPAGHPRGSWPAEEIASRLDGTVVMDLDSDDLLVVARAVGVAR